MKYLLTFFLILWINLGCSNTPNVIPIKIDDNLTIYAEVANTSDKLTKGLMFRKKLNKNQGMLFIFPYNKNWSFWMKNTLIPLDIIWLNENKEIVYIQANAPPCLQQRPCTPYTPPTSTKAKYVLEIKAGLTTKYKLSVYNQLKF